MNVYFVVLDNCQRVILAHQHAFGNETIDFCQLVDHDDGLKWLLGGWGKAAYSFVNPITGTPLATGWICLVLECEYTFEAMMKAQSIWWKLDINKLPRDLPQPERDVKISGKYRMVSVQRLIDERREALWTPKIVRSGNR